LYYINALLVPFPLPPKEAHSTCTTNDSNSQTSKTRIYAVRLKTTLTANAIAHSGFAGVLHALSRDESQERDAVHPTRETCIAEKCVYIVRRQATPIESVNCIEQIG
jgi:hypothetical protein